VPRRQSGWVPGRMAAVDPERTFTRLVRAWRQQMIQVETVVGQPRPSLFTKQMVLDTASMTEETTVGGQLPSGDGQQGGFLNRRYDNARSVGAGWCSHAPVCITGAIRPNFLRSAYRPA
jgi:hypothetical protein